MTQDILHAFSSGGPLLLIAAIAFGFGYAEYVYCIIFSLRHRRGPFPVWMHTFYFAHDLTAAIVFARLAVAHDGFWLFTGGSIALFIWTGLEIVSLILLVRNERAETWAHLAAPPTAADAWLRIGGQILLMLCVVNLGRIFMADEVMFKWFCLTNVVMAVGPGILWERRRERSGTSVGLACVILAGTINTFLPPGLGMWTSASASFDQPWFYATGAVASAIALRNLMLVLRLPARSSAPAPSEG